MLGNSWNNSYLQAQIFLQKQKFLSSTKWVFFFFLTVDKISFQTYITCKTDWLVIAIVFKIPAANSLGKVRTKCSYPRCVYRSYWLLTLDVCKGPVDFCPWWWGTWPRFEPWGCGLCTRLFHLHKCSKYHFCIFYTVFDFTTDIHPLVIKGLLNGHLDSP
jgi:hypothetical protein